MADETFNVGEIAILQNLTGWPGKYNGEETEVVGPLKMRHVTFIDGVHGYCPVYVIAIGGDHVGVEHCNLRKKRPPQKEDEILRVLEVA